MKIYIKKQNLFDPGIHYEKKLCYNLNQENRKIFEN